MQILNLTFSSVCIIDIFSLSRVPFAFCISQALPIRSLRDFVVHNSAKAAKSACPSFHLSPAAAYNSEAQWMLFFTIIWSLIWRGAWDYFFSLTTF